MKKQLLFGLILILFSISLAGCSSKDENNKKKKEGNGAEQSLESDNTPMSIDVSSCINLLYSGYDGMGVVDWSYDYNALRNVESLLSKHIADLTGNRKKTVENTSSDNDSSNELDQNSTEVSSLLKTLSFWITPEAGLRNGDQITVKIVIDDALLKEYNIVLEKKEFSRTVTGLKAALIIDPFEGLEVRFSGTEESAEITVDNSDCSDFVRNYVLFDIEEKQVYRNGDEVVVSARLGDNLPDDGTVYLLEYTSKTFGINGLNEHPRSFAAIDLTSVIGDSWDSINGTVTNYLYNTIQGISCGEYSFNNTTMVSERYFTYKNYSFAVEKMYTLTPKANKDVNGAIVYLVSMKYDVDGFWYGGAPLSDHIETYLGVYCYDFYVDSNNNVIDTGKTYFLNKDWEYDVRHTDSGFDVAYNKYVASFVSDYIIDEVDLSQYEEILK